MTLGRSNSIETANCSESKLAITLHGNEGPEAYKKFRDKEDGCITISIVIPLNGQSERNGAHQFDNNHEPGRQRQAL